MTPLISPLFLLQGIGMILLVVCAVGWWQRSTIPAWSPASSPMRSTRPGASPGTGWADEPGRDRRRPPQRPR